MAHRVSVLYSGSTRPCGMGSAYTLQRGGAGGGGFGPPDDATAYPRATATPIHILHHAGTGCEIPVREERHHHCTKRGPHLTVYAALDIRGSSWCSRSASSGAYTWALFSCWRRRHPFGDPASRPLPPGYIVFGPTAFRGTGSDAKTAEPYISLEAYAVRGPLNATHGRWAIGQPSAIWWWHWPYLEWSLDKTRRPLQGKRPRRLVGVVHRLQPPRHKGTVRVL